MKIKNENSYLYSNQLSGTIPTQLGKLPSLQNLWEFISKIHLLIIFQD